MLVKDIVKLLSRCLVSVLSELLAVQLRRLGLVRLEKTSVTLTKGLIESKPRCRRRKKPASPCRWLATNPLGVGGQREGLKEFENN